MNQQFLEITLIPFIKAFLEEVQSYAKDEAEKQHKSFDQAFRDYFETKDTNKIRFINTTWDILQKLKGKQIKIFAHLENDQVTMHLVELLRKKYKYYNSASQFQQAFFADEDGSNQQRVRENIYLLATGFENQMQKLEGVPVKSCSAEQITKLRKLLKTVLGEARYKQIEAEVFLPDNKVLISNDLAYELESAFAVMVEGKFEEVSSMEVAFDRQKLSLDAVVKVPQQSLQILTADGEEDVKVELKIGTDKEEKDTEKVKPIAKLKNLAGVELKAKIEIPDLEKEKPEKETSLVYQPGELSHRDKGGIFADAATRGGSENEVTHVGPVEGYEVVKQQLPLPPRPHRFGSKHSIFNRKFATPRFTKIAASQDYTVQQKAKLRFSAEQQKMQKQTEDQQQRQLAYQQNIQQHKQQTTQTAAAPQRKQKNPAWRIMAASAGITGAPLGFSGFIYMFNPNPAENEAVKTIALAVDGANQLLANIISLFA